MNCAKKWSHLTFNAQKWLKMKTMKIVAAGLFIFINDMNISNTM